MEIKERLLKDLDNCVFSFLFCEIDPYRGPRQTEMGEGGGGVKPSPLIVGTKTRN